MLLVIADATDTAVSSPRALYLMVTPLIASQETGKTSVDIVATKHCLRLYIAGSSWLPPNSAPAGASARTPASACCCDFLPNEVPTDRYPSVPAATDRQGHDAAAGPADGKLRQMLRNTDQRPKLRIAAPTL